MLFRVALYGFAESDLRALASFLQRARGREPGYRLVHGFADADVILADGDSAEVIAAVVSDTRLATTLFLSEHRPLKAAWHVARPTNPAQLLLALDELAASLDPSARATALVGANDPHAQAKAAARRARLVAGADVANASPIPPDVLVLDPNDGDRDHLCGLLEHFGFCAYPARNSSQALWLVDTRAFRAAFLDVALDGSDQGVGIELCRRVKDRPPALPGPAAWLFIVAGNPRPSDRVLAALAGSDAFLTKPLGRGDVAGSLEAFGVAMPSDDRHR